MTPKAKLIAMVIGLTIIVTAVTYALIKGDVRRLNNTYLSKP